MVLLGEKDAVFGKIYLNDHFQLYITQCSSLLALQPLQRLIFSGKKYKKIWLGSSRLKVDRIISKFGRRKDCKNLTFAKILKD